MANIQKLFLLLTIIGPLHMAEQLMTSIEEFYLIRGSLSTYYSWFDPAAADSATVILITVVWTICSVMFYALLREGLPRLLVVGLFGFFAATEVHHIVEAVAKRGYDAGVITCIPYSVVGVLMLAAVWHELQRLRLSQPRRASQRFGRVARAQAGTLTVCLPCE